MAAASSSSSSDGGVLAACGHELHAGCLWGILPSLCLGAESMMRCPLCRHPIDRYDLIAMGYGDTVTHPRQLAAVAQRCHAFRSLVTPEGGSSAVLTGVPRSTLTARLVQRCASLTARDGFVYNTCVLPLERMLHHKQNFANSLHLQLSTLHRSGPYDRCAFIDSSLACHVDVLIHTAHHAMAAAAVATTPTPTLTHDVAGTTATLPLLFGFL